jgi:RNA polymerase subunit RPABC4/transcription elongation factor Spt4
VRKHAKLIVFVSFIAVGALGLASIIGGGVVANNAQKRYYDRMNNLLDPLYSIERVFTQYGAGDMTKNAAEIFVKRLEDYSSAVNNVVIVDDKGKILYKRSDSFLHAPGGTLSMAWIYPNAVMMDNKTGKKYWFRIDYLDDMTMDPSIVIDQPVWFGEMKKSKEDLGYMLRANDGSDIEAAVTFYSMERSQKTYYLLWFRDINADGDIAAVLSSRTYPGFWNFSLPIGLSLLLLYWLLVPVWVFLDASRRQAQPLPWALLVLLTNLVGLAVYWIYQTQSEKAAPVYVCPACGRSVGRDHLFCPWCAASLVGVCKHCGKSLENGWVSCPWCGMPSE